MRDRLSLPFFRTGPEAPRVRSGRASDISQTRIRKIGEPTKRPGRPEERPPYFTVRQKFRNLSCVVLRPPSNDEREPLMKTYGISTLGPFFLSSAPDDSPSEAQRRRSGKPAGRSGERIRNERHRIFRRSDGADGDLPRTGIVSSESRIRKSPGGFAHRRAGDRGFRSERPSTAGSAYRRSVPSVPFFRPARTIPCR